MPNHLSTKKRVRQDKVRNLRNRIIKKQIKTVSKKITDSKTEEEKKNNLCTAYSIIDKAQKKNIFHKNKIARMKSNLAKTKIISE